MDVTKVVEEIRRKYPEKNIIFNPPDSPTEIVCEIVPTSENKEQSVALAVVGKSKPHYHKKCTEIYEAVKGILTVYKDGKKYVLQEGDKLTIEPNIVHYVEGDESWFLTYSEPGWVIKDHIITE